MGPPRSRLQDGRRGRTAHLVSSDAEQYVDEYRAHAESRIKDALDQSAQRSERMEPLVVGSTGLECGIIALRYYSTQRPQSAGSFPTVAILEDVAIAVLSSSPMEIPAGLSTSESRGLGRYRAAIARERFCHRRLS